MGGGFSSPPPPLPVPSSRGSAPSTPGRFWGLRPQTPASALKGPRPQTPDGLKGRCRRREGARRRRGGLQPRTPDGP
ncbi:hypothetical protein EJ357_26500 [Streptomyces cyaneochromogenes]|uniref:Uncharacterized protein n=1 Tax=Streptomyces cyaneochromogenes TaxID=2496836 RepID=A0A3S9MBW8_9ACTN|nr:hypothetical protein EJ357_26500 [Streptomyces cyaneochromogenes]